MGRAIKYTDDMVDRALALRASGAKQVVIHALYGPSIEGAIRRVQARRRAAVFSKMDRSSRALWQAAAARKREWFVFKRSASVVADVKFTHRCLLDLARRGVKFDPCWWA